MHFGRHPTGDSCIVLDDELDALTVDVSHGAIYPSMTLATIEACVNVWWNQSLEIVYKGQRGQNKHSFKATS